MHSPQNSLRIATLVSLTLCLVSCGSLSRPEKRELDALGRDFASVTVGDSRAALRKKLGPAVQNSNQKQTWERVPDDSNGERLEVVYNSSNHVADGEYTSWRGDNKGCLRWRIERSHYLPKQNAAESLPGPLKRDYSKKELQFPPKHNEPKPASSAISPQ